MTTTCHSGGGRNPGSLRRGQRIGTREEAEIAACRVWIPAFAGMTESISMGTGHGSSENGVVFRSPPCLRENARIRLDLAGLVRIIENKNTYPRDSAPIDIRCSSEPFRMAASRRSEAESWGWSTWLARIVRHLLQWPTIANACGVDAATGAQSILSNKANSAGSDPARAQGQWPDCK